MRTLIATPATCHTVSANLPMVVITVIEYRRAPEKFHGCSGRNEYFLDDTGPLYECTWNVLAVIPHPRLLDDGGLVGVDGCGHLQGPVGEMECVVSEWAEITRAVRIN